MSVFVAAGAGAEEAHKDHSASHAQYISAETAGEWVQQGKTVTFVDVREADEFEAGHIGNAFNITYDQVASIVEQLPKDQPIVLYCIHSAHRAPVAAATLRRRGVTQVYVLEGGLVAWQEAGLPLQASNLKQEAHILPKTDRCDPATHPAL